MEKSTIFFISITILLIIFICKVTVKPSNEEPVIFVESEEPKITGHATYEDNAEITESPEPTMPPSLPEQLISEQTAAPQVISNANCIDDRIELLLTNPTNKTLELVKDIIIHLNGMIVVDPKCYIYTIMPRKEVYCSDISGHLAIRKGKKNTLQLSIESEKFNFIIDCENQ